jgi:hypothetical protein
MGISIKMEVRKYLSSRKPDDVVGTLAVGHLPNRQFLDHKAASPASAARLGPAQVLGVG